MLVSFTIGTLAIGVSLPLIPLLATDLTGSGVLLGAVVATRWVARLLLNVPAGVVAERVGVRAVFVAGTAITAAGAVATAAVPDIWWLLGARVAEGVGAAMTATSGMALVAATSTAENRGRWFGHLQTSQRLGYWLGPLIGGAVAAAAGVSAGLWLFAALSVIAVVPALRTSSVPTRIGTTRLRAEIGGLLRNRHFALVSLVSFAVFFSMTGAQFTAMPIVIEEQLGLGPLVVGWSLFVSNAVGFALIYPSAHFSDRVSRRGVIVVLLAVSALGLLALPIAHSTVAILVASAALGGGNALRGPATQAYAIDAAPEAAVGTVAGLFRSAGDIGSAIGPLVAGVLIAGGADRFFIVNGALVVAALIAFLVGTRGSPAGRPSLAVTHG